MTTIFCFDDFELDANRLELRRSGVPLKADAMVLRLLTVFVRSPGELITKEEMVSHVWDGRIVSENTLTVAVTRLRKTLEPERGARDFVLTVYGRGYRFLRAVVTRDMAPRSLQAAAASSNAYTNASFVGRGPILAELSAALLAARSGEGGGVTVLTGESGIGKTRVAEVIAREAASTNVPVAWGYCRALGDAPPLWPFAQLLREVVARLPPAARDARYFTLLRELSRLLPKLAASIPDAEAPATHHDATLRANPIAAKHDVFDAVTRVLTLAAEHTPHLLVLDDLHRADEASLELLEYLLAEIPRTRIVLVATMRTSHHDSEATSNRTLARVLGHRNCTRIALQRLSEAHVASYVVALLGDVDRAVSRAVFDMSEGNPFFMTELARQLRHNEHPDIASLNTPNVAFEMVRQRVAHLDDAARGALTGAAVIGRSFSLPLLQSVTGRDAVGLMTSLDDAVANNVIMPVPDSPTEFVFTHELLRAALCEALGAAQRRSWHLRIVEALDQRLAFGEAPIAELAHHAHSALPDGDLRKTVQYCMEAANAASAVYAYADAARYLQHARQALDLIKNASQRLHFSLLLRQAAYVRGRSAHDFQPLAEQLIRLATEKGGGVPLAQAAMLLDPYPGFPRMRGMSHVLSDALASLPQDAPAMRASLLARLALNAPLSYDAAASGAQLDQAIELARTSVELGEQLTTRLSELHLFGGPAHRPRAAKALLELQNICTQHAPIRFLPPVLLDIHRAITAMQDGDLASTQRSLERCEARCREINSELLWHVERFRALLRINLGDEVEGRAALRNLHQRAANGEPIDGADLFCAYDRSLVLPTDEVQRNSWLRALAPTAHDQPNIWALKVRALASRGAADDARRALAMVPAKRLARLPCDREYLGTLGALARAALKLQAPDYVRALYELLLPYPEHFAVNVSFLCEGSVSQLLGMLARSLGDRASARRHLQLAVAFSEQSGLLKCAAEAQLELSQC